MKNIYLYSKNAEIKDHEIQKITSFFQTYKRSCTIHFTTDYKVIIDKMPTMDIIFIYEEVWEDIYKLLEVQAESNDNHEKEIYIVKSKFPLNIQKLAAYKQKLISNDKIISLKTKQEIIRMHPKHILYFEKMNRKVFVHTLESVVEVAMQLNEIQQKLANCSFLLAYVSILVNPYWIKQIIGYEVLLKNGETLPLSQKKAATFRKEYKNYLVFAS